MNLYTNISTTKQNDNDLRRASESLPNDMLMRIP